MDRAIGIELDEDGSILRLREHPLVLSNDGSGD
jgi:hypothetical protein